MFSDFALKLKEADPNSAVISLAGGYEGYFPLAHEFDRGGYETSSAYFKKGSADTLLEIALEWLRSAPRGNSGHASL